MGGSSQMSCGATPEDEALSEDDDYNAGEDDEEAVALQQASLGFVESSSTPPGAVEGTAVVGEFAVPTHEDQDDDYNDDYNEERRLSSQRMSQTEHQGSASVLMDEGLMSSQTQSQAEVPLTGNLAMPPQNDQDDGANDDYNDDYNSDNGQTQDVQEQENTQQPDLSMLDRNNDGVITQAEVNQAIAEAQDAGDQSFYSTHAHDGMDNVHAVNGDPSPTGLIEKQLDDECW